MLNRFIFSAIKGLRPFHTFLGFADTLKPYKVDAFFHNFFSSFFCHELL